jgi:hypothetical protein
MVVVEANVRNAAAVVDQETLVLPARAVAQVTPDLQVDQVNQVNLILLHAHNILNLHADPALVVNPDAQDLPDPLDNLDMLEHQDKALATRNPASPEHQVNLDIPDNLETQVNLVNQEHLLILRELHTHYLDHQVMLEHQVSLENLDNLDMLEGPDNLDQKVHLEAQDSQETMDNLDNLVIQDQKVVKENVESARNTAPWMVEYSLRTEHKDGVNRGELTKNKRI